MKCALALLLVACLASGTIAEKISCYWCSYTEDWDTSGEECGHSFDEGKATKDTSCHSGWCAKIFYDWGGYDYTYRYCASSSECSEEGVKDYEEGGYSGTKACCKTDLCNGSTNLQSMAVMSLLAACTVAVAFKKFF